MEKTTIGVIIGSLRRESFCKKVAHNLMDMLPQGLEAKVIDIGDLAIYNQDFEEDGATPPQWEAFRAAIKGCDGFLFVTPEYNRSFPAVLKNALDWASRDQTHPLSGKPLAIMSVSPSLLGGARVQYHLRQVCVVLNLEVLNQPEVFIGLAAGKFSADGKLTDEETRSRIAELIQALVDQARKLKK